jgi:hypothetical protein
MLNVIARAKCSTHSRAKGNVHTREQSTIVALFFAFFLGAGRLLLFFSHHNTSRELSTSLLPCACASAVKCLARLTCIRLAFIAILVVGPFAS